MRITKIFSFDSAHCLENHPGKCRNMHGHTYKVEIAVDGKVSKETGMVIDFGDLKAVVQPLIDKLDHKVLNDVVPDMIPTAENIATFIAEVISPELKLKYGVQLHSVKVWETPTCHAKWDVEMEDCE